MQKDGWVTWACAGLLLMSATAQGTEFTKLIVFGDSLTDSGNAYAQSGGQVPPPPYFAGRFSDGPVWPEYVASALSVDLVNLAHAGAETGYVGTPSTAPGLLAQVDSFIASSGGKVSSKAAYVIWTGSNDILGMPKFAGYTIAVDVIVANMMLALDRLREAGATKIVVANSPDLGLSPLADDGVLALSSQELTTVAKALNSRLKTAISKRSDKVVYYDSFSAHRHIIADPDIVGLNNVSHGCLESGCLNPSNYFYWDALHPTTKAHRAIADSMSKQALTSLGGDWIGLYKAESGKFRLDKSLKGGGAERVVRFGPSGSVTVALAGDWKGRGASTIGYYDPATRKVRLKLKNSDKSSVMSYKVEGLKERMIPITGDWNGDAKATLGFYDPNEGRFHLKNKHNGKVPEKIFRFGPKDSDWQPIGGDWNGDGKDSIGLYDPTRGEYHLRNKNNEGKAQLLIRFGTRGGGRFALAGDWDGDGRDGIGLYDSDQAKFSLRNKLKSGSSQLSVKFGSVGAGWMPISGNWAQIP